MTGRTRFSAVCAASLLAARHSRRDSFRDEFRAPTRRRSEHVFRRTPPRRGEIRRAGYGRRDRQDQGDVQAGGVTIDVVDGTARPPAGCDEASSKLGLVEDRRPQAVPTGHRHDCASDDRLPTVLAYDGDKMKGPTKSRYLDTKNSRQAGLWKKPCRSRIRADLRRRLQQGRLQGAGDQGRRRSAVQQLDTIKKDIVWWRRGAQAPQLLASGEV